MTDKEQGTLWGQAIGDALGLSAEFMSRDEVLSAYPDGIRGYADRVDDEHRKVYRRGEWTDDTSLMFCAIRSADGGIDEMRTAENFYKWLQNDGRDVGAQTRSVINWPQYKLYPSQAAEAFWRAGGCEAAGNGGIMRTSLLSVWYSDKSSHYLAQQSEKFCRLTHTDPRCVGSCVVLNYLLWVLIKGSSVSRQELISLGRMYDPRIEQYINLAFDNADIAALELDNPQDMGYTLKTLAAGLWALTYGGSFENGLRTVIEQGGDADTNGAVAGAILGARYGISSFPTPWIEGLYGSEPLTNVKKIDHQPL